MSKKGTSIIRNILISVTAVIIGISAMFLKIHLGKAFFTDLLSTEHYITTDVTNYGHYIGNYDDESVTELINAFFPNRIEPFFKNVQYEYRAKKFDTYAFEAYLEFTIEDNSQFDLYVSNITGDVPPTTFEYDADFQIYTISHMLDLNSFLPADSENDERYYISGADMRHILINEKENKIIYVALGVYDGGGTHTAFLNKFFSSFNIDPAEYAEKQAAELADNRETEARFSLKFTQTV